MIELRAFLDAFNTFHNTRVAHVERRLGNAEEAWRAMRGWLRCLAQMAAIVR